MSMEGHTLPPKPSQACFGKGSNQGSLRCNMRIDACVYIINYFEEMLWFFLSFSPEIFAALQRTQTHYSNDAINAPFQERKHGLKMLECSSRDSKNNFMTKQESGCLF